MYTPTEGSISLNGETLRKLPPYKINQKGISRTFQNIRLFGDLSVIDNVKVAYHSLSRHSIFSLIFRLPNYFQGEKTIEEQALAFLKIFNLDIYKEDLAKNLPYGQQRRLEIARALAAKPQLLLLDEPAAGMNPQETLELMNLIAFIREKFQLTVLLIEHDMSLVMGVCQRIYVLDHGQLIAHGKPVQTIVKRGISHVPEGRRVFANMSIEENLELGAYLRRDKAGIKQDLEKVYHLFPRLLERRKQQAGTLSGGEQQMLAMGRALMAKPDLLLLDEPSMGLAPLLVKQIFSIVQEINNDGTTILLVEQNANLALSIADRAYVVETGRIVLSGRADELTASEEVKKAYLGGH